VRKQRSAQTIPVADVEPIGRILENIGRKPQRRTAPDPDPSGEPLTRQLIATRRDSTLKQAFPNPPGGLHPLDLALPGHGTSTRGVLLAPYQLPRAMLAGELAVDGAGIVVGLKALREVFRVTDIESALRVFQDVNPEHDNSGSRSRLAGTLPSRLRKEKWLQIPTRRENL